MDYDRYRDFLLNTHYGGFSFQGLTSWRDKGIPTASFGTVFADPRTHNVDARQYLDLGYKAAIRRWEMGVRVYYDRYAYDGAWAYPGSELNIDYVRGQRWGSELQLSREVLRRHHLTFGVEQRDNLQQDQRNYDVLPAAVVYVDSARSSWMWAGFVQDEYLVTSHLSVSAGVRYDRDIAYNSSTNPRLGIIYRPLQGTSFKVLYGTAFRAPTAFEEYYGSAAATPDEYQQNPNLKSESIRNIEWVWEQDLGRRWQFSTDVFHNNIKDLIALERDPDSGSLKYQNTNQARSTGVGVEFGGRGWHRMEGSASYSFSETEDGKSNQILVNSPRHLGKVKATIPLLRQSLFGSFDMQYESSRETLQRTRIAGVPVLNTTLYGHALKRRLDISVSVYNLLDRGYNDVAPEEDRLTAVRQDGRSFRLKLAWHIGEK